MDLANAVLVGCFTSREKNSQRLVSQTIQNDMIVESELIELMSLVACPHEIRFIEFALFHF